MDAASKSDHRSEEATGAFQANGSSIPWAEIFSQHESVLTSHLQLLGSVQGHVPTDGEAFRMVSTMVNKTIQAMNQFKTIRKHILTGKASGAAQFASSATAHVQQRSGSRPTDIESTRRRKRPRIEQDREPPSFAYRERSQVNSPEDSSTSKHQRETASYSGLVDEDPGTNPVGPSETEDISAEVQRRLRIKEEKRRKKERAHPEKRKRESLLSNESMSPNVSRSRKRVRTGKDPRKDAGLA